MKKPMLSTVVAFLTFVASSLPSIAQPSPPAAAVKKDLLAGIMIRDGGELRFLGLWREDPPPAPKSADPFAAAPGIYLGTPLELIDTPLGGGSGLALWKGRADEIRIGASERWFDADVVWDDTAKAAWVAVLQATADSFVLRVYRVERTGRAATAEAAPTSELRAGVESADLCPMRRIDLAADVAGLTILSEATDESCQPIAFRFEPKSGLWSRLSLKRLQTVRP